MNSIVIICRPCKNQLPLVTVRLSIWSLPACTWKRSQDVLWYNESLHLKSLYVRLHVTSKFKLSPCIKFHIFAVVICMVMLFLTNPQTKIQRKVDETWSFLGFKHFYYALINMYFQGHIWQSNFSWICSCYNRLGTHISDARSGWLTADAQDESVWSSYILYHV